MALSNLSTNTLIQRARRKVVPMTYGTPPSWIGGPRSQRGVALLRSNVGAAIGNQSQVLPVYASGFGDLGWNPIKKAKNLGKKAVKTAKSAVVKTASTAKSGVVGGAKLVGKAPSAAKQISKFAVKTAFLPARTTLAIAKSVGTTAASQAGKIVGGTAKIPFSVATSAGKGFVAPFTKKKKPKADVQEQQNETAQAAIEAQEEVNTRANRAAASGSGYETYSPDYSGGGAYGAGSGDGSDLYELQTSQPLLTTEPGMSTQTKVLIAAGAAGAAFLLYRVWKKKKRAA